MTASAGHQLQLDASREIFHAVDVSGGDGTEQRFLLGPAAVIGGVIISMVLSLVITPAVHYYLSHEEGPKTEVEQLSPTTI